MAALTANKDIDRRAYEAGQLHEYTPVASDEFYVGQLVAIDSADGLLKPGATSTTLTAIGVCTERYTSPSSGARTIKCRSGIFKFANSASTDEIANTEIGATCYIVDDQTVAKTDGSSTRSAAGKVYLVESDGVYVVVDAF